MYIIYNIYIMFMLYTEGIFDSVNGETDKREGSKDKLKLRKSSVRKYLHTHATSKMNEIKGC